MKMARTGDKTMRPAWSGILLVALLLSAACAAPAGPAPGTPPVGAAETPRVSTSPATQPKTSPPAPTTAPTAAPVALGAVTLQEFAVTRGSGPHDVTPATDGGVWYTGQRNGTLGHLDPSTGAVRETSLGSGSAPHGVIVGPDGAPWLTDGGLNAIVRVDPGTNRADGRPLPGRRRGLRRSRRPRAVWHRDHAGWGRLVRVARRQPHRSRRSGVRGSDRRDASHGGPGCPPPVVGLGRAAVGRRMERGPGGRPRPHDGRVARVAAPRRRSAGIRGLCRRSGRGLADGLRRQRD